jgi:hypothetical protein
MLVRFPRLESNLANQHCLILEMREGFKHSVIDFKVYYADNTVIKTVCGVEYITGDISLRRYNDHF